MLNRMQQSSVAAARTQEPSVAQSSTLRPGSEPVEVSTPSVTAGSKANIFNQVASTLFFGDKLEEAIFRDMNHQPGRGILSMVNTIGQQSPDFLRNYKQVADLKKKIEAVLGDVYSAAWQLLVHQGKFLKGGTTLEENKVDEKSFIAVMLNREQQLSVPAVTTQMSSVAQSSTANACAPPQPAAATSEANIFNQAASTLSPGSLLADQVHGTTGVAFIFTDDKEDLGVVIGVDSRLSSADDIPGMLKPNLDLIDVLENKENRPKRLAAEEAARLLATVDRKKLGFADSLIASWDKVEGAKLFFVDHNGEVERVRLKVIGGKGTYEAHCFLNESYVYGEKMSVFQAAENFLRAICIAGELDECTGGYATVYYLGPRKVHGRIDSEKVPMRAFNRGNIADWSKRYKVIPKRGTI